MPDAQVIGLCVSQWSVFTAQVTGVSYSYIYSIVVTLITVSAPETSTW